MLADDLADYLEDLTIGTVGDDIFVGRLPDTPSNCIALLQAGGNPPEQVGSIEHPRLVVRVRNATYLNGQTKAQSVLKALHTLGEQTINGHRYLYVRAVGSINQLGRDVENRSLFSMDFIVTKEME